MTKDLIKSFFSMDDTDFDKLVEKAAKAIAKAVEDVENGNENGDETTESYYKETHKEYNDGELVKKSVKEYVNGECTTDKEFDATKGLGCDTMYNKAKDCLVSENTKLSDEVKYLKEQINDMSLYIDKLNDQIKVLNDDKTALQSIINNVKKCF